MASLRPEVVLGVILEIPDNGNLSVYEDLTDAAVAMPADVSVRLLERAQTWARATLSSPSAEGLATLAVRWAQGNQSEAALQLMRILLEVLPDPRTQEIMEENERLRLPPEAIARLDLWQYEQILKKSMPDITQTTGLSALSLLCDLLDSAVRLSQRQHRAGTPEDYSRIWRPAIEEHGQNQDPSLKPLLVLAVRDAAREILLAEPSVLPEVVRILETRKPRWRVFTRMVLYLLRETQGVPVSLAAQYLANREPV